MRRRGSLCSLGAFLSNSGVLPDQPGLIVPQAPRERAGRAHRRATWRSRMSSISSSTLTRHPAAQAGVLRPLTGARANMR